MADIFLSKPTTTKAMKMSNEVKHLIVAEQLLGKKQRETVKLAATELCKLMESKSATRYIKKIWPTLPDSGFTWDLQPVLELRPLDRLGSEPGKSGIKVVSGRFKAGAPQHEGRAPSEQMIVKISPEPDEDGTFANRKYQELIEEGEAAKHLRKYFPLDKFSCPFRLYKHERNKVAVLWAPFESPDPAYLRKSSEYDWEFCSISDMNMHLSVGGKHFHRNYKDRKTTLYKIIDAVKYLEKAHKAYEGRYRNRRVDLVNHYEWELRGFLNSSKDWSEQWWKLWGDKKNILDFGSKWPNPRKVCEKLQQLGKKNLRMGCIHGDLHPRNILFDKDDQVKVIDFGWARPRPGKEDKPQHIVKDFVLLEANLRFVTLPPFLPYDSVKEFAKWIRMDESPPQNVHVECKLRIGLIQSLREIAKEHVGKKHDWDSEYIVPLFLVSLGLLKHCHSADCTWAARYNVLRLARYLVENNVVERM